MAAKTVLNYLDRDSVVHKMTGTTKLAFFLLFTFASMITYNTWVLWGLFAVSLAAFKLSKIKYRPESGNESVWNKACIVSFVLEI